MNPVKLVRILGVAAFLCFGTTASIYAQHDDKQGDKQGKQDKGGQQHGQQPQQRQQQPQRAQQQQQQQQPQRAQQPQQQQPQRVQAPRQQHVQQQQQPPQRAQQPQQQQPERAQPQQQQQGRQQPQAQQRSILGQPQRTREQAQTWQQQRGWLQQGAGRGTIAWQQNRAQHWSSDHRTWAQRGGYGGYYIPQQTFGLYFGRQHFFRIRSRPTIYMGFPRFEYGGFSFLMVDPWPEYWADTWYDTDDLYVDYDDGYYLYNRAHPGVGLAITIVL